MLLAKESKTHLSAPFLKCNIFFLRYWNELFNLYIQIMVATLTKSMGTIEDLFQIKYDVFMFSIYHWAEKICTAGKIYKSILYGPLMYIYL